MKYCINTYTGIKMNPLEAKPEELCIEDIAHALSLQCRGNGHVKSFFSVGQHCLACAEEARLRGESPRVVLACLLHDAGECYLSDLPSPVKRQMPEYRRIEDELLEKIYVKFLGSSLSVEEEEIVEKIDKEFLAYDLHYLLGEELELPTLLAAPCYDFLAFSEVEKKYLELFYSSCQFSKNVLG